MDFSNYTIEQMDALDHEVIKHLEDNDYFSYLARNNKLGRPYEVGGIQKDIEEGKPRYANRPKALSKKDDGSWEILVWMCGPRFEENPICVDEKTFIKTMLGEGVSQSKIDEFIAYEVNWDDF